MYFSDLLEKLTKKGHCLRYLALRRIKFQAPSINRISPHANLAGIKLTTLFLICDCKISSISFAFFILSICVVWIFLILSDEMILVPGECMFRFSLMIHVFLEKRDLSNEYPLPVT